MSTDQNINQDLDVVNVDKIFRHYNFLTFSEKRKQDQIIETFDKIINIAVTQNK